MTAHAPDPLPVEQLRWRCDPESLPFRSTETVAPLSGIAGQSHAMDALRFALECRARDQNVYVRGIAGTGRMAFVQRFVAELPCTGRSADHAYVHEFERPDQPRRLTFAPGRACAFRGRMAEVARFVGHDLERVVHGDVVRSRRQAILANARRRAQDQKAELTKKLGGAEVGLVNVEAEPPARIALFPTHAGEPVPPEELEELHRQGTVGDDVMLAWTRAQAELTPEVERVDRELLEIELCAEQAVNDVIEQSVRTALAAVVEPVRREFQEEGVDPYLSQVVDDVVARCLEGRVDAPRVELYGVNIVHAARAEAACPVAIENAPTVANLLGRIEPEWEGTHPITDYRAVRAGSLLRADGGVLVLDARDVLADSAAWQALTRTLRSRTLEIAPAGESSTGRGPALKPQPIPVDVRVILVGDEQTYRAADRKDTDFRDLFKVLADFDTVIDRTLENVMLYVGVLARFAGDEGLPPFDHTAAAALAEHGARVAGLAGKLTARLGRLGDIAREAAYLATKAGRSRVGAEDVLDAVRRSRLRADLPSRRFQEYIKTGVIRIQTRDAVVGQVNGLAVIDAGQITYGFPARITATIGAGNAGVVDIEGQASLSGSIHTKGFHILGGLLRHLLRTDHPLTFSASLAFEQSYGGIDGDSASTAEICCLLSALTEIPIRQDLAITGAIDQLGSVQAIGAVNEKIEGFFDVCREAGFTGTQGAIIPGANVGDLMLRHDVLEAVSRAEFHVYAVDSVQQALEVLTGVPAGERARPEDEYPDGTLLRRAVARARQFWERSFQLPAGQQALLGVGHAAADPRSVTSP